LVKAKLKVLVESTGYLLFLFYRQILHELLPANLVPVLEAEEWKQVTSIQPYDTI